METRSFLEDKFLLLYSDNFIQFDLNKLTNFYYEKKLAVSLLLAPKQNGNIKSHMMEVLRLTLKIEQVMNLIMLR